MKLDMSNYSLSEIETVLKILFGEDWKNAKIQRLYYPFEKHSQFNNGNINWKIHNNLGDLQIWNRNGKIYDCGVFATAEINKLPEKFVVDLSTWRETELRHECLYVTQGDDFVSVKKGDSSTCKIKEAKGRQYLTKWQYEELTKEKYKIGDIGLFWDDNFENKTIGKLHRAWESSTYKFECVTRYSFKNFKKIDNPENVNLKELLK